MNPVPSYGGGTNAAVVVKHSQRCTSLPELPSFFSSNRFMNNYQRYQTSTGLQHIIKFRAINLKQGYLQPIKININGLKMHLYYDFQGTNYGSNGMGKNSLHFQIHSVSLKNVIFQTLSVPWTMSEMVKYKDSEL